MTCPQPKSAFYTMIASKNWIPRLHRFARCTIQKQQLPLLSFLRWKYSTASSEMIMAFFASPWQWGNSGHVATRWSSTADPHALQMNAWVKQSNALEVHPEPSKSTSLKSSKASYEQATSHHNKRSKEAPEQDTSSYNCQHIAKKLGSNNKIVRSSAYGIASRPIFRVR